MVRLYSLRDKTGRRLSENPVPMRRYAAFNYDDYLCLRPPLLLWIAVLYLSRAITLPIVMGLGYFVGVDHDAINLLQGFWTIETLFPSLIAATMLYAMVRRLPSASTVVRWIWAHGRILLTASAVMDLVLLVLHGLQRDALVDQAAPSLVAAILNLYFVLYILMARRVRDTFADFPAVPA